MEYNYPPLDFNFARHRLKLYGLFWTRLTGTTYSGPVKTNSFILQRINKEAQCITVSVIPLFYQTSAIWEIPCLVSHIRTYEGTDYSKRDF